jgi:hypothetical protein
VRALQLFIQLVGGLQTAWHEAGELAAAEIIDYQ